MRVSLVVEVSEETTKEREREIEQGNFITTRQQAKFSCILLISIRSSYHNYRWASQLSEFLLELGESRAQLRS